MSKNIRFVSVLSLLAAAAASHALAISINGSTTSGITGPPVTFTTTVVSNTSDSPFNSITSGVVNFTATGPGSSVVYSAPTGTATFTFNSAQDDAGTGVYSFSAPAQFTSATGSFAPYLSYSGTLTVSSTSNTTNHTNSFAIGGNINTPEPASFAALGVGALALIRRRRKA